jgi:hypothetical protein
MIDDYSFGSITINGKNYSRDIIIYPDGRIQDSWWRKSGHSLCRDDIKELIESEPDIIIAGTGSPGLMKPDSRLEEYLSNNNIEFKALPTKGAALLYNRLSKEKSAGACFHLTC